MSQAQQPEAHALYLAQELEAGSFMPNILQNENGLRINSAAELRRLHARVQELEAEVASERRHKPARDVAAVRTLAALGYDWHGGEQWKPPVTQALQERKYRQLAHGEAMREGDQFMDDDTVNWHPVWKGVVFAGACWSPAYQPMRREITDETKNQT